MNELNENFIFLKNFNKLLWESNKGNTVDTGILMDVCNGYFIVVINDSNVYRSHESTSYKLHSGSKSIIDRIQIFDLWFDPYTVIASNIIYKASILLKA